MPRHLRREGDLIPAWFEAELEQTGFLRRWPGFAGLLASVRVVEALDVPVMAVGLDRPQDRGRRVRLLVNRSYFEAQPEHFEGCLLHELHHVAYGHLDDARLHAVDQPRWMELAMELAANEGVTAPLPPAFHWEQFVELGVHAGQSTAERYGLLVAAFARGDLVLLTEAELDERFPDWRNGPEAKDGSHRVVLWPKSPTRRRLLDGRPVDQHVCGRCAGGARGLGDALEDQKRRLARGRPDTSEARAAYVRRVRSWTSGVEPAALEQLEHRAAEVDRAVRTVEGTVDWRAVLRRTLGERAPKPNWARAPRRFPDRLGQVPGRSRRPHRARVLAVVDTSASMQAPWLDRASGEIGRLAQVATVTIAEADARVHRRYAARPLDGVLGGGDTDFRVALEGVAGRWDVVVYFTDGRGPWPETPPCRVVWALLGEGAFDCPWGTPLRLHNPW